MAKEQVSTTLRALQVLECFMDSDTEWTLKMLVAQTGLPTTTAYRQLSTLTEQKYLEQDPIRKSYRIGPRLLMLASAIMGQSDLRRAARPEMERLSEVLKETVNLSTLTERHIFYLDKVETRRSIVCNTRVGTRLPAHVTGTGKVLLSHQSEAFVNEYCEWMTGSTTALTKNTITDPEQLRQELARARADGYAMDLGEIENGLICVAAPIFDISSQAVAAISVSGPDYRVQEHREMMIREVCQSARAVSYMLGYRGDRPALRG